MSARNILMAAAGSADDKLYVDDVFSAYTYTGNSSTQTINNGIDLAGKGGMVWTKGRDNPGYPLRNTVVDTVRGVSSGSHTAVSTDGTEAQAVFTTNDISSFTSSGYSFTGGPGGYQNNAGNSYVSWTFRKAPKFFDVVTYTGNGSARTIAHSLGVEPGLIIIKGATSLENWQVWHKDFFPANNSRLYLNTSQSVENLGVSPPFWGGGHTATAFSTGGWSDINATGVQYVAYLFAHDPSADGIIQCGASPAGNPSGKVALGWEPQYVLFKATTSASDWYVIDSSRGAYAADGGTSLQLKPNSSAAEALFNNVTIDSTGFNQVGLGVDYIYLAIRRPNKPPTTGTQVYNAIAYTGDGVSGRSITGAGFTPDTSIIKSRSSGSAQWNWLDRLRSAKQRLASNETGVESNDGGSPDFLMDGFKVDTSSFGYNNSGLTFINHFFKRAPGFFDVVCYTGTGADRNVPHSLGVVPEMMIVKSRSTINNWNVFSNDVSVGSGKLLFLDTSTGPQSSAIAWNNTSPSASVFTVGTDYGTNQSGDTFVAYLFASLPGISKVGSYTGNGSSQTINCGFTTGARFILIKRTNSTGDWYVWDTARGIVSANDPHLSLNTTAAEVTTDDSVDPASSGFIVNQVAATNINVSGGQYIFLAIA